MTTTTPQQVRVYCLTCHSPTTHDIVYDHEGRKIICRECKTVAHFKPLA
jgi:ribosomal protein S27E